MADTKKPDSDSDNDTESTDAIVDAAPDEEPDNSVDSEEAELLGAETETVETELQESSPVVEMPDDAPAPAPAIVEKKGGFAPALIGGVLAAGLGFFAARTEVLDSFLPGESAKAETAIALTELRASDAKQAETLTALRADIDAIDLPDLGPINTQLEALQVDSTRLRADIDAQHGLLRDLESRLTPLGSRLEALEKRPMTEGASKTAMAAYDRELATLQQSIAAQRAEVESMIDNARASEAAARELEANAANTALLAQNQATFARLIAALDSGDAFAPILAELSATGIAVPPVLNEVANDGVPTLTALNDAFPAAARAALSSARADGGGGLGGFLQRQLGARSVQPKQGDDPDAILSRAEAAVTAGELPKALQEISSLPENAQAELQDWIASANTRLTALKAAEDLAQSLNTN